MILLVAPDMKERVDAMLDSIRSDGEPAFEGIQLEVREHKWVQPGHAYFMRDPEEYMPRIEVTLPTSLWGAFNAADAFDEEIGRTIRQRGVAGGGEVLDAG